MTKIDEWLAIDDALRERIRTLAPYWKFRIERECVWQLRLAAREHFFPDSEIFLRP
jgi:hypothetical protein